MPKFRKKPVEVEALQYKNDAESIAEIHDFVNGTISVDYSKEPPILKIPTLEGEMKAKPGDYIIKGVEGEFYPCRSDIFDKTYEKVE